MNLWTIVSVNNNIWQRRIAEMEITAPVVSLHACARFMFFNLEHYTRFDPFCYTVQYEEGLNFHVDLSLSEINIFLHEFGISTSISNIPKRSEDIHQFLLYGFDLLIINEVHIV